MGSAYSYQLGANGGAGAGSYTWQVSSGTLPDGLTLSTGGLISGVPAKTGSFSAEVRATSGAQTDSVTLALTVTAPTLVAADVVSQILGTRTPLTADELHYLDLLGNHSGSFDVGDFVAWVDATGAQSPALTAAMAALGVDGVTPRTARGGRKP
jgi:Putative Ig domain